MEIREIEDGIIWPLNIDGSFDEKFLELLKLEKSELAFIVWKLTKKVLLIEEKLSHLKSTQPDLSATRNTLHKMLISEDSSNGECAPTVSAASSMCTLLYVDDDSDKNLNNDLNKSETNADVEEHQIPDFKTVPDEIISTEPEKSHPSEHSKSHPTDHRKHLNTFHPKEERQTPSISEIKTIASKNQTQYRKNRQRRKRGKNKKKKTRTPAPKQQSSTGSKR
ncbi:uncharacterized protein [Palaemon carinicauda]|uniref:uncharacterized protein n=1 Tax=Palaemon carinicauda TaxID=392227 RepID=UPI0035B5C176